MDTQQLDSFLKLLITSLKFDPEHPSHLLCEVSLWIVQREPKVGDICFLYSMVRSATFTNMQ